MSLQHLEHLNHLLMRFQCAQSLLMDQPLLMMLN
jgi:hypothetical protein